MTRKLFIRDEAALNAALFTSLPTFKDKYKEFADVCDLETLYHSMRTDACRKQRKTFEELKAYVEKEGAIKEVIAEKMVEEGETKVKKTKETKTLAPLDGNHDIDLQKEVAHWHAQGLNMPAAIKKEIDKQFNTDVDIKDIRKVHYKLLGK